MDYKTGNEEETIGIAERIGAKLLNGTLFPAVFLSGALGAGKTVFARALIRYLSDDPVMDVPSPTFTLLQLYDTNSDFLISHFDLYRLNDPEEILALSWDDIFSQVNEGYESGKKPEHIMIVEWPERLGYLMPQKYTDIVINTCLKDKTDRENERTISVRVHGGQ